MNQYLLLRDNKQSGPYSVEELVAKGLKPYDLVWLEGKSAAWRYPSELEDLKPYAPAVEEQPYDRFYKKPGTDGTHEGHGDAAVGNAGTPTTVASTNNNLSSSGSIPSSNGSTADASADQSPIQHTISSNKIHVILPAGNHTLVVKNNEQPINDDQKPAASVTTISHADSLPGNDGIRNDGIIGKNETDHTEAEKKDGTIGKKNTTHVSQPVVREKFVTEEKQIETTDNNHRSDNRTNHSIDHSSSSISLEEAIQVVMANAKEMQAASSGNTVSSGNTNKAGSNNTISNNTVSNNSVSNIVSKNTNTVAAAISTWEEESAPLQEQPLQEQLRIAGNRRSKPNNYKMLLRGTIAACLVLGGIVIGLVINRQPSTSNNQATLDQLVSQLQEREKQQQKQANNAAPLIDQSTENTTLPDNSTNDPLASHEVSNEDPYGAATPSTEAPPTTFNKEKQLANKPDQSFSQTVQEPEMKIVPAVVTNKKEEKDIRNSPNANYARENIHQLVSVEASDFKTGVLGGISGLQLTVINGSLFAMDQVEVQVNFLGPEKRVVKTQTIVFNDLGAGIQKTLDVPKTNRGVSINYMIKRIQSKELGIAHAGF